MQAITVFCGSSTGSDPAFADLASTLGKLFVRRNIQLVFGGGKVGLMGQVADAVLAAGGRVTGVIPRFLARKEVAHDALTEMIFVESMHERKMKMHELCDGFIALPGGFGTLEELLEMVTWAQLGLHGKPVGVVNVAGYYDHLFALFDHMVGQELLRPANRALILQSNDPEQLLSRMADYHQHVVPKWMGKEQT